VVNVGLDIMGDAFNQRTLDGFRAQLWGRMAKEAGARSVERERQETTVMEGVESETGPMDSSESPGSSSPQSSSSGSLQQTVSSSASPQLALPLGSSTPPQPTISSSPSLSMLNSPAGIRSVMDSSFSQPSLFQASIFGSGFATGKPAQNAFSQRNTSSAQARAMLQAQWLALQQSRQQAVATPNQQQQGPAIVGQRETYLAQFAQAVAAQQAQQQAQLGGLAKEVRPAFFTGDKAKAPVVEKPKTSGIVDKLKATTSASASSSTSAEKRGATPQQAALFATIASQTLLQRMGSAFWDAFSGTGVKAGAVDTDKVRRVLEGKAVIRIVDVEKESGLDGLEERMKKMTVATSPTAGPSVCSEGARGGLDMFSNLRGKK